MILDNIKAMNLHLIFFQSIVNCKKIKKTKKIFLFLIIKNKFIVAQFEFLFHQNLVK